MPDKKPHPKVIGFAAAAGQELANRRLDGVIHYMDEYAVELTVRDFRYQAFHQDVVHLPPPPWNGIADGMIIYLGLGMHGGAQGVIDWLKKGNTPMVSLVQEWHHPEIPIVAADKGGIMKMATEFLISRGYKNFAFVGNQNSPTDSAARRKLFDRRLAKHGFTSLAHDMVFKPLGAQDDLEGILTEQGLIDLLRNAPKPLGLFALNDNYAHAISMLCESLKIDVPGEVGILGMGDLSTSRCNMPTISTVQIANDRIGYEGARILHGMMKGQHPKEHTLLIPPVGIIERQSTSGDVPKQDDMLVAREYIRDHACEGLEVQDIVRKLSISRRTFEMQFTAQTGQSPKQMIQQVRLERVKHLLANTQLSITQVALMTGFGDASALANFTNKATGKSPSELREG
jgi:LacI family transcriptional regulator